MTEARRGESCGGLFVSRARGFRAEILSPVREKAYPDGLYDIYSHLNVSFFITRIDPGTFVPVTKKYGA